MTPNGKSQHSAKRQRVLIIGLDGATFDLLQPWAEAGKLPQFRSLMQQGTWGELRTVVPPITGPAWTSFLTGKNPGKHGIYDFMRLAPGTYDVQPVNTTMRSGASLWSLLSQAGKRVGVLNVPAIYPPEEVNGVLVTGMMTPPHAPTFTHPPELGQSLEQALGGYDIWPAEVYHPQGRETQMVEALSRLTLLTEEALIYLQDQCADWDFFMTVFMATDVTQHFTWHFMDRKHKQYPEQREHPLRDAILRCYQEMDQVLGRLIARLDDETTLIVMSDHGFGSLEKYIYVNSWLLDSGFMHLKRSAQTRLKHLLYKSGFAPITIYQMLFKLGLGRQVGSTIRTRKQSVRRGLSTFFLSFEDVDWSRTRAYSLGNVGPIYVNLEGREPHGIVKPGADYDRLLDELEAAIQEWRNPETGQPISGQVYRRDELFNGSQAHRAPDLFFVPDDLSYQAFGDYQFPYHRLMGRAHDRTGGHRMNGIFMAKGPTIVPGQHLSKASIMDIAPTTLALLGVPIPRDMDGRVLEEMFLADALPPITYTDTDEQSASDIGLSADEEEMVRTHLEGLGYLG